MFIGREKEIKDIQEILSKKEHNSVVLIGDIGVGKTSLVKQLVKKNKGFGFYQEGGTDNLSFDVIIFDRFSAKEILDSPDIRQIIKEDRRKIFCLNFSQYQKLLEFDEGFFSGFEKYELLPIIDADSIKESLKKQIEEIEAKYCVHLQENALDAIISLSNQYLSDQYLPFKVLNIIDILGVKSKNGEVSEDDVYQLFGNLFGKSLTFKGDGDEVEKLLHLEEIMGKHIIGHKEAIATIAGAIRVAKVGLLNKNRPLANFMFLGPTGVGKTEAVKALCFALFGDRENMIRIDCSEYSTQESIYKLIGPPPGTVGYENGGLLTNAIMKNPNCVVLLDELEKADRLFHDLLLQLTDEGTLTDNHGKRVNFRNCVIIMTSNVGSNTFAQMNDAQYKYRLENGDWNMGIIRQEVDAALLKTFRPEFINRLDETIIFGSLTQDEIEQVIRLKLEGIKKILKEKGIEVTFKEDFVEYVKQKGFQPKMGGRPVNRVLNKELLSKFSMEILKGAIVSGDKMFVGYSEGLGQILLTRE